MIFETEKREEERFQLLLTRYESLFRIFLGGRTKLRRELFEEKKLNDQSL